ncbi:hypothetical protein DCCM_2979 [Desulfocucumis palustris]|uniref:Uncharacterized protein n=1 Tax=Desulfocucumis palustris TaxID=1898651 RepID=A0A2L2XC99_9FIRM|nr:hypothetical protein DCCM_2979 [Desulfocucumis palustris]
MKAGDKTGNLRKGDTRPTYINLPIPFKLCRQPVINLNSVVIDTGRSLFYNKYEHIH